VLNATFAADDAQGFATTFGMDDVQIAPTSGAAVTLRVSAMIAAGGTTALAAQPTNLKCAYSGVSFLLT
jgi:hypothetical protein